MADRSNWWMVWLAAGALALPVVTELITHAWAAGKEDQKVVEVERRVTAAETNITAVANKQATHEANDAATQSDDKANWAAVHEDLKYLKEGMDELRHHK